MGADDFGSGNCPIPQGETDARSGIVHVEDLIKGMILAAAGGKPGEYYIISAGDLKTYEMFDILGKKTGIAVPAEEQKPLVRVIGNLLDPIKRLLSWQQPLSLERALYKCAGGGE